MQLNLFYEDTEAKPKKPILKIILIICIVILVMGMIAGSIYLYMVNEQFESLVDKYVFAKEISSEKLKSILINDNNNQYIGAYNKYIVTIEKGQLEGYNNIGKKIFELSININNPLIDAKKDFLVVAETKGQKLYYISSNNIAWEKELEGEILSIHTNKNGYLSVILRNTSHKSIIITFDNKGKELFRIGFGNTRAVDVSISNDNKYLAIAEVNTNGSIVKSNVKIVSIERAMNNEKDVYVYTYSDISESLIIAINFQDKNRLVCMYDNRIDIVYDNQCELFSEISSKDSLFVDIKLDNTILKTKRVSTGLFAIETEMTLINTNTKKEYIYKFSGTPKRIYTHGNLIAIDLGSEIHFINGTGWLIKKYSGSKEAKSIVLGEGIGGIIYRDKIELLNL